MPTSNTTLAEDFSTPRARKQLTLFLAGASFFTLSTLITRRAIHRKHIWPKPHFYDFSNAPPSIPIVGSVEALEALQIATLNVFSFAMMVAGGLGWGFNVSGVQEWRAKLARKRPTIDVDRDPEEEAKELEGLPEWITGMMSGKDGVVERARDMKRREAREAREKVDEIRSREEKQEREGIEERFAVVEERTTDRKEKPWWKPW